jgi:hypothetical protein
MWGQLAGQQGGKFHGWHHCSANLVLSTYFVPGTVLATKNTAVKKEIILSYQTLHAFGGRQTINKNNFK